MVAKLKGGLDIERSPIGAVKQVVAGRGWGAGIVEGNPGGGGRVAVLYLVAAPGPSRELWLTAVSWGLEGASIHPQRADQTGRE
jgi:hypothetical protein